MENYHPIVLDLVSDRECLQDRLEDADSLMKRNVLYIVHSKPDDNNFKDSAYSVHSEWCRKLRGQKLGPVYIQNRQNSGDWFRGYIYSPETNADMIALEQLLLFDILQGDVTVERLDLSKFRAKLQAKQDQHFESLFSMA